MGLKEKLNEALAEGKYCVVGGSMDQNSCTFHRVQLLREFDDLLDAIKLVESNFSSCNGTKYMFSNDRGFYYIENTRIGPQFGFCMVMYPNDAKNYRWADDKGKINKILGL